MSEKLYDKYFDMINDNLDTHTRMAQKLDGFHLYDEMSRGIYSIMIQLVKDVESNKLEIENLKSELKNIDKKEK